MSFPVPDLNIVIPYWHAYFSHHFPREMRTSFSYTPDTHPAIALAQFVELIVAQMGTRPHFMLTHAQLERLSNCCEDLALPAPANLMQIMTWRYPQFHMRQISQEDQKGEAINGPTNIADLAGC
jgi:hypothetical protein